MSEANKPHNKQTIDEDFIINNYNLMTAKEIGESLGVSRETINHRAIKLKLRKIHEKVALEVDELVVDIEEVEGICLTSKGKVFAKNSLRSYKIKYPKNHYALVVITRNNKRYELRMHRLMAKYFIPNIYRNPIVNHIDGDKHNFELDNLEWVTVKQNSEHASKTGLLQKGEKHVQAKITDEQAKLIWSLHLEGKSVYEILSECPFATESIVEKIKYKVRWKHITG